MNNHISINNFRHFSPYHMRYVNFINLIVIHIFFVDLIKKYSFPKLLTIYSHNPQPYPHIFSNI